MRHEVVVRFEDGTTRVFDQDQPPVWRSGDPVRVRGGIISARG